MFTCRNGTTSPPREDESFWQRFSGKLHFRQRIRNHHYTLAILFSKAFPHYINLYNRLIVLHSLFSATGLMAASTSLPIRITIPGKASISSSEVRKLTTQARSKNVPWGISEAASCERNHEGDYRYHAFGVPGLALNPHPSSDIVASPYATFLSLHVDTSGSIENLRVMKELNWLGAYGFYEAADFTLSRVRQNARYELVRCWMAHHQGMSLVALANLLTGSPMHRRFHAQPMVAATERLLHEKLPRTVPIEHGDDQARKRSTLTSREQHALSRSCYWPDQPTANVAT